MSELYTTGGVQVALYDTSGRAYFRPAPPPSTDPEPEFDPASLTELRHFVTHAAAPRFTSTASATGSTIVSKHQVRFHAKAPRVRFGGDGRLTNLKGKGWIVAYGANFPLTFGGQPTGAGVGHVLSDPLPESLVLQPGTDIYVVWQADPNTDIPSSGHNMSGAWTRATEGVWDGVLPAMSDGNISLAPPQIMGLVAPSGRPLSVGLIGDSFTQPGWARKAFETQGLAWTDLSRWLEATPTSRAPLASRLGADGPVGFDVIFTGHGGNNSYSSLEEQQAIHIANWRWIEATGAKVAATTLHPYTSSTDGWKTVEGQSHVPERNEPARVARNDWLRDGAPIDSADNPLPTGTTDAGAIRIGDPRHPLDFPVFDQADACETSRNSGIWKPGWPVDGTHLHPSGSDQLQPYFEQWVADNLA